MPFPDLSAEDRVILGKLTDFLTEHFNEQPMIAAQTMGACIAVMFAELSDTVGDAVLMADAFAEDLRNAVRMDEKWDVNQSKRSN